MNRTVWMMSALLSVLNCPAYSQATSALVGAGYSAPEAPQVAPGQIVNLYFRGAPLSAGQLRDGRADPPLPTTLAGLSARMAQEGKLFDLAIAEVRQQNTCGPDEAGPACILTTIKAQIPYEINGAAAQDPITGTLTLPPAAELALYADGEPVAFSPLQPVPDNAHVLTACDLDASARLCGRSAFHSSGAPVTAASPAARGETVTLLAYGLGQTAPPSATGAAAQPGGQVIPTRAIATLEPFLNALTTSPRRPWAQAPGEIQAQIGQTLLVSGQVGVYAVQVTVPSTLEPPLACGEAVRSNFNLNFTTSQGTESIPLCVQP